MDINEVRRNIYNIKATSIAINNANQLLKEWYDKILEKDINMLKGFVEKYRKIPIEFFSMEENRQAYPDEYKQFQSL